jgi:hypothetical protein
MRARHLFVGVFVLSLTAGVARAANAEGEVVEIKKEEFTFTIRTEGQKVMTFVVVDKKAKEGDPKAALYKHGFKDLKVGQVVRILYGGNDKGGRVVAQRLRLMKQPKEGTDPPQKK